MWSKPDGFVDMEQYVRERLSQINHVPMSHVFVWPMDTTEDTTTTATTDTTTTDLHFRCFVNPTSSIDFAWVSTDNIRSNEFDISSSSSVWTMTYKATRHRGGDTEWHRGGDTEWCRFITTPTSPLFDHRTTRLRVTYHNPGLTTFSPEWPWVEVAMLTTPEYHHLSMQTLYSVGTSGVFTYGPPDFTNDRQRHVLETDMELTSDDQRLFG